MRNPIPRLVFGALLGACMLSPLSGAPHTTVVAWNNLGMHCMDDDYSVFSILPPFNTLEAQVIDSTGKLVRNGSGYLVRFEAVADSTGSLNTTSAGKTNFFTFSQPLFGTTLAADTGFTGVRMPGLSNTPQPLTFGAANNVFEATGIPIVPWDDAGAHNTYPTVRVTVRNAANNTLLASTTAVLPVSDEMDCRSCHASGSPSDARPEAGWVYDVSSKRDFRLNILRLHDEHRAGDPVFTAALATKGYNAAGLEATVVRDGKPILCASCHASEALSAGGVSGVKALTRAMHSQHASVVSPSTGISLGASTSRDSCYQCHPGSSTRCLRGAMGSAVDVSGKLEIQCQDCHGGMSDVGAATRTGWLDEPNCQACHTGTATQNNGQIRYKNALAAPGTLRVPVNNTFATTPNTPSSGKSLYRLSTGHGGLQCSACHGSTHAEYPGTHPNDNLGIIATQGHVGVLAECTACHATSPSTTSGGPHGMHPVGDAWIGGHQGANHSGCSTCHGSDLRGTVLSRALGDRTLSTGAYGTKTLFRGQQVGCYECHDGPNSTRSTTQAQPVVPASVSLGTVAAGQSAVGSVSVSPSSGTTLRVVTQPKHGTVAVDGFKLVYRPDPGFSGTETFTYAAGTTSRESILGTASVTVTAVAAPPAPTGDERLVNISARGAVAGRQGDANNTFGGFIVKDGNLRVFVQGAGPRLRPNPPAPLVSFAVPDYLTTPRLDVWLGNTAARSLVAGNAGWSVQTTTNVVPLPSAALLDAVRAAVAGYDYEAGSADAGTLVDVSPGPYTMELSSASAATGTGVLGFWVDTTVANAGSFSNVSARGVVKPGAAGNLTAGTVIQGSGGARIVAIAMGPGLAGLSGTLAAPRLTVRSLGGVVAGTNTGWTTAIDPDAVQAALTRVGSGITLDPAKADSALLVTLAPGAYTFEVSSDAATGIALVGLWIDSAAR